MLTSAEFIGQINCTCASDSATVISHWSAVLGKNHGKWILCFQFWWILDDRFSNDQREHSVVVEVSVFTLVLLWDSLVATSKFKRTWSIKVSKETYHKLIIGGSRGVVSEGARPSLTKLIKHLLICWLTELVCYYWVPPPFKWLSASSASDTPDPSLCRGDKVNGASCIG